ncbi:MAG: hypothetical protein KAS32_02475 [Candidatus Peribacteraceae bacterium]|nr:hypothetical protein [Candidatus Peribacteraceae bacterium]
MSSRKDNYQKYIGFKCTACSSMSGKEPYVPCLFYCHANARKPDGTCPYRDGSTLKAEWKEV